MRTTPPYSWESLTLCLDGCFTNRFKGIPCFWTAKGRGEFFPNSFKLNRMHRYLYIFYTFHIHFIHFHTFHIFFWSDNTEINNPTSNSRSPFEIVSSKKAAEEAEKEKDDWRQFLPQSAWNNCLQISLPLSDQCWWLCTLRKATIQTQTPASATKDWRWPKDIPVLILPHLWLPVISKNGVLCTNVSHFP